MIDRAPTAEESLGAAYDDLTTPAPDSQAVAEIGQKIIAAQECLHRLKREPKLGRAVAAWLKDHRLAAESAVKEL